MTRTNRTDREFINLQAKIGRDLGIQLKALLKVRKSFHKENGMHYSMDLMVNEIIDYYINNK